MGLDSWAVAAVDFSEISPAVVRSGLRAAQRLGTGLLVVHALDALKGEEESGPLLPALRRRVDEARAEARHQVTRLCSELGLADRPDVAVEVLPGPAAAQIVERSDQLAARLVVVGCPHPAFSLESTAGTVVRRAHRPVLVVRHPPIAGYQHVVLGVDFSEGAAEAWELALRLAEEGAQLTACHVLGESWLSRGRNEREESAAERLAGWVQGRPQGSRAQIHLEKGHPKAVLIRVAQALGADLLAVGSRGHRGLTGILPGSVVEAAVGRAHCDVLVTGGGSEPPCSN